MTDGLIAVTGAGGFIGSHVVRALDCAGIAVRALLGPAADTVVDAPAGVAVMRGSVNDRATVERLVDGASAIVHLAGPPSVVGSFDDPAGFVRVHVEGTATLCDVASASGVRRIVHVSSAEVYGRPDENPVAEQSPLRPRSPYAASKVGAEAIVGAAARAGRFETIILRPFSVYGPGMRQSSLLGSLVRAARRGEPVAVRVPTAVRDHVHVDDATRAMLRALDVPLAAGPAVYNVCSGDGRAAGELCRLVAALGAVPLAPGGTEADRWPTVDIDALVGDPTLASLELGWTATTSIESGLAAMLEAREVA